MTSKGTLYKVVAVLVSLGMLLQIFFVPAMWLSGGVGAAEGAGREAPTVARGSAVTEPAVLSTPVSISRVQSSYQSGGTVVISFTVTNNLPPTNVPEVPESATYTDTITILSGHTFTEEVNILSDVTVTDTLSGGTFVSAGGNYSQNGNDVIWQLPPILPQASEMFSLTVNAPGTAPDFIDLDLGALVGATRWGETVTAAARPSVVVPDSVSAGYTQGTVDADLFDKDMLWWSAAFQQEPVSAFSAVAAFGYDPYEGSLRGTRGTLWGEAGNSLDHSSLLIAALRAAGVPARYRHGTLSTVQAQTIIADFFPDPQGLAGYLPDGVETADPVNDPELIALVQDHWWVEAFLPGLGWTDLDPTYPGAAVGDIFATPAGDGTDQIAEIPDELRHKVSLTLEVEQYSEFPLGGSNLTTIVPLTATYSTAEIAGKSLTVGHFVTSDVPPGVVFGSVTHTYTPFFGLDGDDFITAGDEFQDLLTNFPLASHFTTAEWLTVETTDLDGNTETFTRTLKDLIGFDARLNGGLLTLQSPENNQPFTSFDDAFALWFLPNEVGEGNFVDRRRALNAYAILNNAVEVAGLPEDIDTPEEIAAFQEAMFHYFLARNEQYALGGLVFAELMDPTTRAIEKNSRVKLFYEQPRIIIASAAAGPADTITKTIDLRSTEAGAIVYPGQSTAAEATVQWMKAVAESYLEGHAAFRLSDEFPLTTTRIFDEMEAQGVEPIFVTPDKMDLLDLYLPDPASYAYAAAALQDGKYVLIPNAAVVIDGEPVVGWWEIDPETGLAVSVLENGLHGAAIEYAALLELFYGFAAELYAALGLANGVAGLWACIARNVVPALQGNPGAPEDCVDAWSPPTPDPPWIPVGLFLSFTSGREGSLLDGASWRYLPDHLCPVDNCGLEQFALPYPDGAPVPLPEMTFGYNDEFGGENLAGRVITVTDNGGGGAAAVSLSTIPVSGTVLPGEIHTVDLMADANFSGLVNAWAYVPEGWQVRFNETTLDAEIVAHPGVLPGDYTVQFVAQSQDFPEVVATLQYMVTIPDDGSLSLLVGAEPNITIPLNTPAEDDVSNQTNDGEAEIPDSAFRLGVVNNSSLEKMITVTVTGAPSGWLVLNGAQQESAVFTLGPNERTSLGLYVVPPTLPSPGTSFIMDVEVTDGVLTAMDSIPWMMPGQAHNYLQANPDKLYVEIGGSVDFDLTMTNVGNAAGSFPITITTPLTQAVFSGVSTPVFLNPDETGSQTATVMVNGGEVGRRYPILFSSAAPGSYTQYAQAELAIVTQNAGDIFQAADETAAACTIGEPGLSAALENLAFAVNDLEASCDAGSCSPSLKDEVVDALNNVVFYSDVSPLVTADSTLTTIATDLAGHTDDVDIQNDIVAVSSAVGQLETEVCEISQHNPAVRWLPAYNAGLVGQPVSYTLEVENQGTITTTYAVTVELPSGTTTFNVNLAPGETGTTEYAPSGGAIGLYDLTATARATGPEVLLAGLQDEAEGALNVVDKFIKLTAVTADPSYVETGTSSTNVSIDVTNIANIPWQATAETQILAPGGGVSYTADIPLTILVGNPKTYDLATANTSGWAAGLYTITVNLVDGGGNPITEGSGYGYFGVGQALGVSQSVEPVVVAPGTMTVTTVLTTEILAGTIISPAFQEAPVIQPRVWQLMEETAEQPDPTEPQEPVQGEDETSPRIRPGSQLEGEPITPSASLILTTTGITRTEQNDPGIIYAGTWTTFSLGKASGGNFGRADDPGDTASFTFNGAWVNLGFIGTSSSANVEVFIDGTSQGIIDLYRREDTPLNFTYDGFITGTHTISVTHIGVANPFAANDHVNLDYIDYWDGTTLPDGTFEQNSDRVFPTNGWNNINNGAASGGSYYLDNNAAAWFPFMGDSVTFQAMAYNSGGVVDVYIDGKWQTRLDLYHISLVTRTLSFENLGPGLHMMMISSYQGNATIDAFTTPGTGPFYSPITPTGYTRFEDDDPAMLYNGFPYTVTARTWTRLFSSFTTEASDSQYIYSNTADDTLSFTFDGVWASIGFATEDSAGMAEIFLDGASQGVVDLYTNEDGVKSVTFDNLITGTHTISVTVLDTANPLADNTYVYIDYVDVWDGAALPSGTFQQDNPRVLRSGGWIDIANAGAGGGSYMEETLGADATVWFPFEGDSITYQAFDYLNSQKVAIYIDEAFQGYYTIQTGQGPTITYSFDGLGAGLHVMKVRHYRFEPTLDAFITPAVSPPPPPPPATSFTRYEEDDPAIRYNGLPYTVTAASWNRTLNMPKASDGQHINSSTVGNNISIDFSGTWVALGFFTDRFGGQVEVFIDGASQGILDLYSRDDDVAGYAYGGLANTNHTVSMTILSTKHPNSSGTFLKFDYYETWDGTAVPAATYEETAPEVRLGDFFMEWDYFSEPAASGGQYINDGFQRDTSAWFPFTGDSVTFLGLANSSGDRVRISVDGVHLGTFNLYSNTPVTRPYTFDGLGAGPHIIQVSSSRAELNLDAFVVPGIGPATPTPVYTGVVRYEEDNPALIYNDQYDFYKRPQSWTLNTVTGQVSGRWHVHSSAISSSVSLEFDGRWAAVGFRTRNSVSQANIFIDGVNMGLFDLNNAGEDTTVIPFGGLLTGTHTISVSVAAGTVYFDYIDIWDGQPMSDEIINLRRSEDNGRIHYSASLVDNNNANAIEGDFITTSLLNNNSNIWYTFVGDAFTFFGYSRSNTTYVDLYVDGVFIETIDVQYPYSEQPIAFHYSGFGEGPHVVRIHNGLYLRADAFQSNPTQTVPYSPIVEWYDNTPYGGSGSFGTPAGMLMGIAAGDVNGDGLVEIVAPSDTFTTGGQFMNSIFVFRGDGLDTGDGDPIITRIDFPSLGTGLGRETIGSVALADLDGLPGSEIIVGSEVGMYAFHHDGSTLWFTDTFQAVGVDATPAVGNLDFDPEPEIVVNMNHDLVVYNADGTIGWSNNYTNIVGPPLLADMNNDGRLDIVFYDISGQVYLYDYNFGSPTLVWQTPLATPISTVRGGPAVADLDGDGTPEIAMTHDGYHTVIDKDGNVVWSTPLDPGAAGGVSIADIDGDFQPEIVTGIKHDDGIGIGRLYALNADGSILWEVPAYDSTSANSQAVLDINGDGVYEIAWNGAETGFAIFNGADGSILFNEPLANSLTGTDYPIFADVDLDGFAEVVIPTNDGLVVLGQDGVWGESRPLWNQHTYHITNINDDLSVPFSEANSWQVHNTYRTQWPEAVVLPVYDVTLTHTVGISGVAVVSSTFSVSPTTAADPVYGWDYTQTWASAHVTRTFDSVLTGLQPGESRLVAQGTEVAYELPSGINFLTLPPMYVSVPHIISVVPVSLTVGAGGTAIYDIVLDNPALAADTYTLTVAGLTPDWLTFPVTVPVGAGSQVTVPLTVDVPDTAALTSLTFSVIATNSSGGVDQAGAKLTIIDGLDVSIDPASQSVEAGTAVSYTLTVSNYLGTAQTYILTASGGAVVTLPPTITVPAGSSATLPVSVSAASNGSYPFTISAGNESGADSDSAVLEATGDLAVGISLAPATVQAGPLTPAVFTVTVTNLGSVPDTYDLDVSLPAGWTHEFKVNGSTINSLSLPPSVFNSADVLLLVTPDGGASPGTSDIGVSATSQTNMGVSDSVTGTVDVQNRGVDIAIIPQSSTMLPTDTGIWQVTITNTGSVADSYWLTMTGFIGPYGSLASNPVALNAGQSTTVQLTADNLDLMLPGTYQFAVSAESQNNAQIRNEAIADVTFLEYEAVDVAWVPAGQTVTDTLAATFIMVISNTGNVATTYDLSLNLPVSLTGQLAAGQLPLPAHVTAYVVVDVQAIGAGVYMFDGTADSTTTPTTDSSTATLEVVLTNLPPSVNAGGDETADEGQLIQFNGAASDPEGQPIEILWDFGDGNTAGGTLTPTHAYDDDGIFTVTLVVTDDTGLSSSDTLTATINNVAPMVNAGMNQNAFEGDTVSLDPATFSDPGTADTHTATINWGDGTVEPGTVNQGAGTVSGSHIYNDNGNYTVIVIVNDDDGGQGSDSFSVTVANVAPQVNAGADQTADEGDTISLDPATFIDSGADDTHTATIDWGDGTIEPGTVNQANNTVSGSHAYQDNGIFTVTVTVTDDDGGSDSDTLSVTVNNVAPTVNAGADQNVDVGDTVSLDPATFTDPGGDDTHTATIDWGDGTVESGTVNQANNTVSGSHVYTSPGTYTVTVTVIDDDGGQSSDTFTVFVTGPTVFYNYVPAVYK